MDKGYAIAFIVISFVLGIFVGVARTADLEKAPGLGEFVKAVQLQKSEPEIIKMIRNIDEQVTEVSGAVIQREQEITKLGFGSGIKVSTDPNKTPLVCPTGKEVVAQFSNAGAWESGGVKWQLQYRRGAAPQSVGFSGANFSVSSRYMSCRYSYQNPEKPKQITTIYVKLQPKSTDKFVAYGNYWRIGKNYASCQSGREACAFILE